MYLCVLVFIKRKIEKITKDIEIDYIQGTESGKVKKKIQEQMILFCI